MSEQLRLYSYWRSSAAYRVRIALNLKGLAYDTVSVHLVRDGGEQHHAAYRHANPQALVPMLQHGDAVLRQSMAIIEYLDEVWPQPALLPSTAVGRQAARSIAQLIACDIHPLNNLRVLQYFEREWHVPQPERDDWVHRWIKEGFAALEALLTSPSSPAGQFCVGDTPTLADCCLVPQMYNARRFSVDLENFPTLQRIERTCLALPAFDAARPEKQPDAPPPQ